MKLETYQKAAERTLPSLGNKHLNFLKTIVKEETNLESFIKELGLKLDLAHMALGVASELSELEECLIQIHKEFDEINLEEELGDKMWYAVNWANLLNIIAVEPKEPNKIEAMSALIIYSDQSALIIYGGQLADIAKRYLAYGATLEQQEEKRKKAKNYLTNTEILNRYIIAIYNLAGVYGLNMETIMGKNITKLYVRYPEQFSEDMALMRDLEAERLALEGK